MRLDIIKLLETLHLCKLSSRLFQHLLRFTLYIFPRQLQNICMQTFRLLGLPLLRVSAVPNRLSGGGGHPPSRVRSSPAVLIKKFGKSVTVKAIFSTHSLDLQPFQSVHFRHAPEWVMYALRSNLKSSSGFSSVLTARATPNRLLAFWKLFRPKNPTIVAILQCFAALLVLSLSYFCYFADIVIFLSLTN